MGCLFFLFYNRRRSPAGGAGAPPTMGTGSIFMPNHTRFDKLGERPKRLWWRNLLENLRSRLTWMDALVGLCLCLVIAAVLVGYRYQVVPVYEIGQIAGKDVRAAQDVTYEDSEAAAARRAEAEAAVPALYQLDSDLIAEIEKTVSAVFAAGRLILAQRGVEPETPLTPGAEGDLLKALAAEINPRIPRDILPILLRQRFSAVLEGKVVKALDTVLRDGIVMDRGQFLKDQRTGIVVRDTAAPLEHPLSDAYIARDLPAAAEQLRRFIDDLPELAPRDRRVLGQSLGTVLAPTLVYNREETESRRTLAAANVQPVYVQVKRGQLIVRAGEKVTPSIWAQLNALRNLGQHRSLPRQFGGFFLLALILTYFLWRYLAFYQTRHRRIRNHAVLILVVVAAELLTIRLATALADILGERFQRFHDPTVLYYGIPFAFGALLITLLVDVNLGIITSMILAILAGLFYGDADLAVYLIVGSLAGIYSIRQYKDRAAILKAGLTLGLANLVCMASLNILRQTPLRLSSALDQVVLAVLSGLLASALASMLLPALEAIFKLVTDIRLLEMSSLNAPLLRRLSVEAPGTYHHSLMVAALAESAAEAAGANPLLARVASYYHDIGKLLKPEYFAENQRQGSNKHEELSPSMSCIVVSSHVKDGMQMAKEAGLPDRILDIIPQHHGTRLMTYFYQKAKESAENGNGGLVEADFRYPGPKPQSKEAAIIMMADAVEAASKTLSDPIPSQIQKMIGRLVDEIVADHQLDECDITLRDIQLVKESFFKILAGIFHHRVDYPGYNFKQDSDEPRKAVGQDTDPKPAKAI